MIYGHLVNHVVRCCIIVKCKRIYTFATNVVTTIIFQLKNVLKRCLMAACLPRAELPGVNHDPLKFRDSKRYADRIKDYRKKTDEDDAIVVAHGTIGGNKAVVACFNFAFMAGSMGMAVGEGILTAARLAVMQRAGLIIVPASGGARMQESVLSLMQMSRTTIGIQMVKEANLPYIVLLSHPTTGGVSASFAMLGDIHIAEPGCTIGFAGRRVIEQTVREQLPDDFQTAEYLKEHGMVDMVVPRAEQHDTLSRILGMLMYNKGAPAGNQNSTEEEIGIPVS